jgi:GNAT superfamily N-acetyltransferase
VPLGALRRHGIRGLARIAGVRLRRPVYWRETFIWYQLDLDGYSGDLPLHEGYELTRADEASLGLAAATGKDPALVRRTLAEGHDLWIVRAGGDAAFSCWVYRGRAPEIAAKKGWFDLPANVVCLEDSVTVPEHRGKGVAPAAWAAIAEALAAEGVATMITRVAEDNGASRHACRKVGFAEIGKMEFKRTGPRSSQRLLHARGAVGQQLAEALAR